MVKAAQPMLGALCLQTFPHVEKQQKQKKKKKDKPYLFKPLLIQCFDLSVNIFLMETSF